MRFTRPDNELITTATVATICDVVPDTVRVWKRAGKILPAFETPRGQCLYRRADAERVRDERQKATDRGAQ